MNTLNTISISLDNELLAQLNELTTIFHCQRSALIRFLITQYLEYVHEEVDVDAVNYINELRNKLSKEEEYETE